MGKCPEIPEEDTRQDRGRPNEDLPVAPVYSLGAPGDRILLAREEVECKRTEQPWSGKVEITMRFLPRPRVEFAAEVDEPFGALKLIPDNAQLSEEVRLPIRNVSLDVLFSSASNDKIVFISKREPFAATRSADNLQRVTFHVVNFPPFISTCRQLVGAEEKQGLVYSVILECETWRVSISSFVSTPGIIKKLKASCGYAITHAGRIERSDGQVFSSSDAEEALWAVQSFLSFAAGRWIPLVLPVGFDQAGERIWEQWGCGRCARWTYSESWFDYTHGDALAELFPGFMSLWENENWHTPLSEAVYWDLLANERDRGSDTGIVLAQAAMEVLAWTLLVTERQALTPKGYRDLWASDRFRLLFSFLGIPKEMPDGLPDLAAIARERNWSDALHALTEIRNSIIHPERKNWESTCSCLFEAWQLALWLLDLLILRLCDYQGKYGSRLDTSRWRGNVIPVPWRSARPENPCESEPEHESE